MEVNGKLQSIGNMQRHEGEFSCPVHGKWKGYWFFSKDTDEPVGDPVCPKCREDEEKRRREEDAIAARSQEVDRRIGMAGVPDVSSKCRLSNYIADTPEKQRKLESVKNFVEKIMPSALVMFGTTGSGKTHLAVGALAGYFEKSIENGTEGTAKYTKASELLRDFKSAMNAKRGGITENQLMHEYQMYDFLIIDETNRFNAGEYNTGIIQEIISSRLESDRKTILIFNGSFDGIGEYVGEHNMSRLKMCGRSIPFDEQDWRATHRRTNNDG